MLRTAIHNSPDGIFWIKRDGSFTYVNDVACQSLGYTEEELLKIRLWDIDPFFPKERMDEEWKSYQRDKLGTQLIESFHKKKDGTLFPIEVASRHFWFGENEYHVAFVRNVSERKRVETLLYLTQTTVDRSGVACYWVNSDSSLLYVNEQACKALSYTKDELLTKNICDIDPGFPPERWPLFWDELTAKKELTFETIHKRKDGSVFPVEITADYVQFDQKEYSCAFVTDISVRKANEMEQQHLIHELEDKNAELERFTYTVSHDLKSPMITIQGFLGILDKEIKDQKSEEAEYSMNMINQSVHKMKDLLDDVLQLSRIGRVVNAGTSFTFKELFDEAMIDVSGVLKERDAQVILNNTSVQLFGDRLRLKEVLVNLLENASKFVSGQERPQIHVDAYDDLDFVVVSVKDNGIGIEPDYHHKIFGLFEKLNPKLDGTGIGLAIVKRIVEVHRGRIWVESELGKGSTFFFSIPKNPETA